MIDKEKNISSREQGAYYETQARLQLEKAGYKILEQNYRFRKGEIDLIARDGEYLCFIEVKFRQGGQMGKPEEAVDKRKQKRISKTALYYLMDKGLSMSTPCRFDVICAEPEGWRLIKNAFTFQM